MSNETILQAGEVALVGAGPGHPDLITVRGLNFLQQADVVFYDRLIPRELLCLVEDRAELVYVGKRPGDHRVPQADIEQRMVAAAHAGRRVVRLKGGDPFVFGRGGEEMLTLRAAGVRVRIVPGISSMGSVPAYAGIPLTHKGLSDGVTVLTGREDPTKPHTMNDWAALARRPTLVLLMALGRIERISQKLLAHGRDPHTPVAAVSHGATNHQRVVRGRLDTIAARIRAEKLPNPAVIVVGEVAALADELGWFVPDGTAAGFALPEDALRDWCGGAAGQRLVAARPQAAIVGAGPGAADLITVRGRQLLATADVVLHDRLISDDLLALISPQARVINVGKGPTRRRLPQAEIDRLLVSVGRRGGRVVRLKGGDPFVFAFGARECGVLREAGIAYEVVPGVTSVTAVPGAVGIPVTHRGLATSFTVLSGHNLESKTWDDLPPYSTFVVVMGIRKMAQVAERLRQQGVRADTPAAVIASGTTAAQQVVRGTVGTIAARAAAAEITSPGTLVVGQVVGLLDAQAAAQPAASHPTAEAGWQPAVV